MQNPSANDILKIHRGDTQYPARLNDLYDPPECLYIKGDMRLLNMPMIAVVGSRMASRCPRRFWAGKRNRWGCPSSRPRSWQKLFHIGGLWNGARPNLPQGAYCSSSKNHPPRPNNL